MGLLLGLAAMVMHLVFWGLIGLVWYIDSFWMAAGTALPFLLLYWLFNRQSDFEDQVPEDDDPTLNAFQQPLSKPRTRKLPG